jgi:tRNA pseudouridine55 synthase
MDGILLIDKPAGWTSFDVVNKVRYLVQQSGLSESNKKRFPVGHTGTLDPLATGLLVLVLGDYCRRAQEFSKLDKTYEVAMRLGVTSTTGDEEGDKTVSSDRQPNPTELTVAIERFEGEIMQTPPIYSAIKVNGQRAYDLARAGKTVELEPRPAYIEYIRGVQYAYPEVRFTAHVSSGTYIRSLVEDIGKLLETGAYMTSLRRTAVGHWHLNDALPMEGLTAETIARSLLKVSDDR